MRQAAPGSQMTFDLSSFTPTSHGLVRVLISSYFVALSLGVISGTDLTVLATPFLPSSIASFLTGLIVFTLAVMVLIGVQRRAAALLLAIVMFWASYMAMLNAAGSTTVTGFWRDLALIGALILTYADANETNTRPARFFRTKSNPSHTEDVGPSNIPATRSSMHRANPPIVGRRNKRLPVDNGENLFREDFDVVRLS